MRLITSLVVFLFVTHFAHSSKYEEEIEISIQLLGSDVDSSYSIAQNVLEQSTRDHDSFGLVKSNFILGYIHHIKRNEFGKAIIYYLEAIRYGEESNQKEIAKDLITLYKNCGVIFRKFKSYDLAEEYYLRGIHYAKLASSFKEEMNIFYNLSSLERDQGNYLEAIGLLEKCLPMVEVGTNTYFNYSNRLAITYRDAGQFLKAIEIHEKVLSELPAEDSRRKASYYHNLAKSYKASRAFKDAVRSYSKAIEFKTINGDTKALFSSYFGLAETYIKLEDLESAKINFDMAEELLSLQPKHPDYFEIYNFCADLNYDLKKYKEAKKYNDLYSKSLNEYLETQAKIQESEQRINMDLITKRYFAEVDKQDRIAEIMFASQLTSGGLLTLLLLVIGYHRYQKIMLRRSIERELVALKIIE